MTDFPFQAEDAADSGNSPRDRKTILLAGALAAVVLGGGAYYFLGSSSGDDGATTTSTTSSVARSPRTAAKAAKTQAQVKPVSLPAAASTDVGRNPFKALYIPPAPIVVGSTSTTASGSTAAPVVPSGPGIIISGSGGSGGSLTPVAPQPTTHPLVLRSVSSSKSATGTFTVSGKSYVVPIGKAFGPSGELVVVAFQQGGDGVWTAVLRVGDSAPFDARQGDTLQVM